MWTTSGSAGHNSELAFVWLVSRLGCHGVFQGIRLVKTAVYKLSCTKTDFPAKMKRYGMGNDAAGNKCQKEDDSQQSSANHDDLCRKTLLDRAGRGIHNTCAKAIPYSSHSIMRCSIIDMRSTSIANHNRMDRFEAVKIMLN